MGGKSARTKGHSFEREIAAELRSIFPGAKRGFQTRGGSSEESDVKGTPFSIECKARKSYVSIVAALKQAKEHEGIPVVVSKLDRQPRLVSMELQDWVELVRKAYAE